MKWKERGNKKKSRRDARNGDILFGLLFVK